VVLHIREGKPVRVSRVEVEGLDPAPEAKARASALPLAPGKSSPRLPSTPAARSSRRRSPPPARTHLSLAKDAPDPKSGRLSHLHSAVSSR